ncbi:MAG: alpha/beta fold hydrolase [Planctomycetaceae bacterium]|nr:alpha/beta fold hydrolase [Planctomycetaceae bacterium]
MSFPFLFFICVTVASATEPEAASLWDVDAYFAKPPAVQWGEPDGLVRPIYYEGELFNVKPTRVFAYYGRPEGDGPFPAVLLIHGGGGKAFPDWVELWAKRGYVALAPDLAGNGPDGRLEDGGPNQADEEKFRTFSVDDGDYKNMWTWQVIAALLRGHALLAAQEEVDADRIAATGISWGGYLTCILAGVDTQLKAAVPVYGCGFLDESSAWKEGRFDPMTPEQRQRWVSLFDPSRHLDRATCPMLFINGTNDFAYHPKSWSKSTQLPKGPVLRSFTINLPHGHIFTFKEVDAFIDSFLLRDAKPLATVTTFQFDDDKKTMTTTFRSEVPVVQAELIWTSDGGEWPKREWRSTPATMDGDRVHVTLPPENPKAYSLVLTDERGLQISSQVVIP